MRLSDLIEPEERIAPAVLIGHAFGNQHAPLEVVGCEVRIPVTTSPELAETTVRALGLREVDVVVRDVRLGLARPLHLAGHVRS